MPETWLICKEPETMASSLTYRLVGWLVGRLDGWFVGPGVGS